jgi:hypothetical protein
MSSNTSLDTMFLNMSFYIMVLVTGGSKPMFLNNLQYELNSIDQYWAGIDKQYGIPIVLIDSRKKKPLAYKWGSYKLVEKSIPHPREKEWANIWLDKPLIQLIGRPDIIPFKNARDILVTITTPYRPKQVPMSLSRTMFLNYTSVKEEIIKPPGGLPKKIRTELMCVFYIRSFAPMYKFIHNKGVGKKIIEKNYRPDLRMNIGVFYLIVEIDENAHRKYESDMQREYDIAAELQSKCVFIRYNPDHKESDLDVLIEWIKHYMNNKENIIFPDDKYGVIRRPLYYDLHNL